jgi:hypothetical protein
MQLALSLTAPGFNQPLSPEVRYPGFQAFAFRCNLYRCYATDLAAFLKSTVPGVFAANPNLKPAVIVDKAVAMWDGGNHEVA